MLKIVISLALAGMLAACAQEPAVQPVTIGTSDFCAVMKGVLPPSGKPSWDIADTKDTIRDARKVGAAVDRNCNKKTPVS